MSTYHLTPDELEAWKAVAHPVVEGYLASAGELGQQLYEAALKLQQVSD